MRFFTKTLLLAGLLVVSPIVFTGCGGIEDAFQSTKKTVDNTLYISKNEKSVLSIPTNGVSGDPIDENSSEPLPPSLVEFKIISYPSHGSLIFTSSFAIYTPKKDYSGQDFYSFEIYDNYNDEITTYNITMVISNDGDMPVISGDPSLKVVAKTPYSFTPTVYDKDTPADQLVFSIENKPVWAVFSPANGTLSGTPDTNDVGTYSNIKISVTDGRSTVSLNPFSITVVEPAQNVPPTIQGVPTTVVDVSQAYEFTPIANDPDGDTLTFSIANLPAWPSVSFDTHTGKLSWNPNTATVGTTAPITISVSDGLATASLPPFTVEVK